MLFFQSLSLIPQLSVKNPLTGSIPSDIALDDIEEAFGVSVSAANNRPNGTAFFHKNGDALKISDRNNNETGISINPGDSFEINVTFSLEGENLTATVNGKVNEEVFSWSGTSPAGDSRDGIYMTVYGAYEEDGKQAKGDLFMTLDSVSFTRSEKN